MLMRCVFDGTVTKMVPMTPEEEAATLAGWAIVAVPAKQLTLTQLAEMLKAKGLLTDADLSLAMKP